MKKKFLFVLNLVALSQTSFALNSHNLFEVTQLGGAIANTDVTLCLNAEGPISCQHYPISHVALNIKTFIPHHTYSKAGIKINSDNADIILGCTKISNGFCLFSASDVDASTIFLISKQFPPFIEVGDSSNNDNTGQFLFMNYSTDGGKNWINSPVERLDTGNSLHAASCSIDGANCVSVGEYVDGSNRNPLGYYTRTGGLTWNRSSFATPPSSASLALNGVSCGSDGKSCVAVGRTSTDDLAYYTTDGGVTWQLSTNLPTSSRQGLNSVSCSGDGTTCFAVGSYSEFTQPPRFGWSTTDGGKSWSTFHIDRSLQGRLEGIACGSMLKYCVTVGSNGRNGDALSYHTTDGGDNWSSTLTTFASGDNLLALSCSSDGLTCTTVGFDVDTKPLSFYTTDGGLNWNPSEIAPQGDQRNKLTSVACNSTGLICAAGGWYDHATPPNTTATILNYYTTDGGKHWTKSETTPQLSKDDEANGMG